MFTAALSVGVVNALLKIIVLVTIFLVGEAAQRIIKLMTMFRLQKHGEAPLVFPSDTRFLAPLDMIRRLGTTANIGVFLIAVICVGVVPAEMATDFGVRVSTKCSPERLPTVGICATKVRVFISWDKMLLTSFQVEDTEWENEMIVRNPIREGFRKRFEGNEYFGDALAQNKSLPIVVGNCTVSSRQLIPARAASIEFTSRPAPSSDGIRVLKVTHGSDSYSGMGMLTNNNLFQSAFLTVKQKRMPNGSPMVSLLEYPNSEHAAQIKRKMTSPRAPMRLSVTTQTPLLMYNLSCGTAAIFEDMFRDAIYAYRLAQLSRSGKRKLFPRKIIPEYSTLIPIPHEIEASDVVRAVMSSKISEPLSCSGETFVYTSCGAYEAVYAIPLAAITSFIVLTMIACVARAQFSSKIFKYPFSAKSWGMFAMRNQNMVVYYCDPQSEEFKKKYEWYGEKKIMNEYVLTEDGGYKVRCVKFYVDGNSSK